MNYEMGKKRRYASVRQKLERENNGKLTPGLSRTMKVGILAYSFPGDNVDHGYYDTIINSVMTEIKRLNPSMQLEFRYVHQTVYEQLNDLDALFIIGKFTGSGKPF